MTEVDENKDEDRSENASDREHAASKGVCDWKSKDRFCTSLMKPSILKGHSRKMAFFEFIVKILKAAFSAAS